MRVVQDLRSAGLVVDYSLVPAKSDKQFKRAQELNATHTIKLERSAAGEIQAKARSGARCPSRGAAVRVAIMSHTFSISEPS